MQDADRRRREEQQRRDDQQRREADQRKREADQRWRQQQMDFERAQEQKRRAESFAIHTRPFSSLSGPSEVSRSTAYLRPSSLPPPSSSLNFGTTTAPRAPDVPVPLAQPTQSTSTSLHNTHHSNWNPSKSPSATTPADLRGGDPEPGRYGSVSHVMAGAAEGAAMAAFSGKHPGTGALQGAVESVITGSGGLVYDLVTDANK